MRILVVSDTHGDLRSLIKAVDAQRKAEIIVHCGDAALSGAGNTLRRRG